jgi:hypothetical protein
VFLNPHITRKNQMRVLLIGIGDLGKRIALQLTALGGMTELVLVGRRTEATRRFAALVASCGKAFTRAEDEDVFCRDSFSEFLRREQPDVIVQCAALMSPWALQDRKDAAAVAVTTAGFAAQLCAQLPIVHALMSAHQHSGLQVPVINCSYPDVTNPLLARFGLAPTLGVGNVAMIADVIAGACRRRGNFEPIRVFAHHAHVQPVLAGAVFADPSFAPRVYVGDNKTPQDALLRLATGLPLNRDLNALSAAHAVAIVRALGGLTPKLSSHAPAPFGLAGGLPIRIEGRTLHLDLPAGITLDEALRSQASYAQGDGIQAITEDGCVIFTETFRQRISTLSRELAEPLYPSAASERFSLLSRLLALDTSEACIERIGETRS